jgi:hypothetical protein
MTHRLVTTVCCVLAIALAVSCRQPKPAPPPLEPDPQIEAQWAEMEARSAQFKARPAMTAAHVAEVEAALVKTPDDVEARRRLMDFYFSADFQHQVVPWEAKVLARRRHVLWLVAHVPGSSLLGEWHSINPAWDAAGYAQGKALWVTAMSRTDVSPGMLRNAGAFLRGTDKRPVEDVLLREEARDPGGPRPRVEGAGYRPSWAKELGLLYGLAIRSAAERVRAASTRSTGTDDDRVFAAEARTKLEGNSNVSVLLTAGAALSPLGLRLERGWPPDHRWPDFADADFEELWASCLHRAGQLDPANAAIRRQLVPVASLQRFRRLQAALKDVPPEQHHGIVQALPEADRPYALIDYAAHLSSEAYHVEFQKRDSTGAASVRARAQACLEEALRLTNSRPGEPERGTAIFLAHLALGQMALDRGDMASAVAHLDDAGNAPPSDVLTYGAPRAWQHLSIRLLKRGERESVARFLDRLAAMSSEVYRAPFAKAAAQIRAGRMPAFYQRSGFSVNEAPALYEHWSATR